MKKIIRETISATLSRVFIEQAGGASLPLLSDDLVLLESGLDSMGFAVLVVELEEILGFDPFSISEEAFYPSTFGEFVSFYEKHEPK
jgi:acyl carrier protein